MENGVSSLHGVIDLEFAELPEDLLVPIVSVSSLVLLTWNEKNEDYLQDFHFV